MCDMCCVCGAVCLQEAVPFAHAFDFVQEYMQERFVNPMLTYVLVTGVLKLLVSGCCDNNVCEKALAQACGFSVERRRREPGRAISPD